MVSLFSPSRCVLLVGDEALYVYSAGPRGAVLADSVPWQAEDFEDNVTQLIRKECKGKPVLILNDMTDQHFKGGQRLPKVSSMDKAQVLRRKLQVSFPNYPIRGALQIKQGREAGQAQKDFATVGGKGSPKAMGGLYLFAAVPMSEPISKTIAAVRKSMAPIAGFCLLPVEASDMVTQLAQKISGKGKKAARWTVFIGQHQNGDLRQVITRDGQLAMTRMTSVANVDTDPDTWAREVNHELKATISYLSRFGYTPDEGTDMIVIAAPQAGEALEKLIDFDCNYRSFTAPEAARIIGVNIGQQEEPRFADPLHVAWAGRKTRFIMPMEAAEVSKIYRPRQYAMVGIFALALGGGYFTWQVMGQMTNMMGAHSEINTQTRAMAQVETEYNQEIERMAALGFDVKLIQGSISTFEAFEKDRVSLLPIVAKIGEALGNELRLDFVRAERVQETVKSISGESEEAYSLMDMRIALTFPATINPEVGIREINNLERQLKSLLPGFDVKIERQVASPEYTAATQGTVGQTDGTGGPEAYPAEISIRGPK